MKITITQEIFDKSISLLKNDNLYSRCCPIALALKEQHQVDPIVYEGCFFLIENGEIGSSIPLPKYAMQFIEAFDTYPESATQYFPLPLEMDLSES